MKCKKCGTEVEKLVARDLCTRCYRLDIEEKKSTVCKGCNQFKPIKARGLCNSCYVKWVRYGNTEPRVRPKKGDKLCSFCHKKPVHAKNLCSNCYAKFLHHGSPETIKIKEEKPCRFCGKISLIKAHGYCSTCYSRYLRYGTPEFRNGPVAIRQCVVCGITRKIASKGVCVICYSRYRKTGRISKVNGQYSNVDPIALGLPKVSEEDIERRRTDRNATEKINRKKNRKRFKNNELRSSFGITLDEYNVLLEKQKGRCAICEQPEMAKRNNGSIMALAVDHDHKTGKVRALLCANCNHILGHAKDSPILLQKALDYLKAHSAS